MTVTIQTNSNGGEAVIYFLTQEVANKMSKTSKNKFLVTNKFINSVSNSHARSKQIDNLFS